MYALLRLAAFGLIFCSVGTLTFAQTYQEVRDVRTEASEPDEFGEAPLDDVVKKEIMRERRVLDYQPVRESDIMWEKRIWRIIDVREKMNLPFAYPEEPFFKILSDAAVKGDLPVYSVDDDKFRKRLSTDDVLSMMSKTDTIVTFDPETYEEKIQVVRNDINWADVKRFRIKEIWFFDKETSTMQVRILGIAPLIDVRDNEGNFRYEKVYVLDLLSSGPQFTGSSSGLYFGRQYQCYALLGRFSRAALFFYFIIKESNVYDRRIEDYARGVDALWESERIKNAIFNFEQDLWQY